MRIAVLADIHNNFAALEAVVDDIAQREPDHIVVAGDFANRGPDPASVVERLVQLEWPILRGNHEDYVLGQAGPSQASNPAEQAMWQPARWTAELTRPYHEWIESLPMHHVMAAPDGSMVFITHGTPRRNSEGIYPDTSDEQLAAMLDCVTAPLICVAHTHFPLIRRIRNSTVVNVGSVGLPFNGDWRAQYGMMEWRSGTGWEITLRQVEYDRDRTLRAFEEKGFIDGGGPLARLVKMEVIEARPYLGGFVKMYAGAIREGTISVDAAVEEFLQLPRSNMESFWNAVL